MSLARVHNFAISLDGYGAGAGLSRDEPMGHAGFRLHRWKKETRFWGEMVGEPGGSRGVDHVFAHQYNPGIGAEIMGAGKFGLHNFPDDPNWKGWWGDEPPFRCPVFVLTHTTRPSIEMAGGTTFHFLAANPVEALEKAMKAANGKDVRIGGGPTMVRDYLKTGLVDRLHVAITPIVLGRGIRLWDDLRGLEAGYTVRSETAESGTIHLTFQR